MVVMPEADGAVDALYRFAEVVRSECARATGDATTSLGLGRTHDGAAGVRQSFREAEHALEMSRRLLGPGRQASFADLGLHRLLFAMAQHPELSDYYRGTVGELVAYDERSSAELMATLDAYFEANGSPTETAQRLKLHRNTVLYRLRRIEEVGQAPSRRPGDAAQPAPVPAHPRCSPGGGRTGRPARAGGSPG